MSSLRIPSAIFAAVCTGVWVVLYSDHARLGLVVAAILMAVGATGRDVNRARAGLTVGASGLVAAAALNSVAARISYHVDEPKIAAGLVAVAAGTACVASFSERGARSPLHSESLSIGIALMGGLLLLGLVLPTHGSSFADWNALHSRWPLATLAWLLLLGVIGGAAAIASQSRGRWGRMVGIGALVPLLVNLVASRIHESGYSYALPGFRAHDAALVGSVAVCAFLARATITANQPVADTGGSIPPPPGSFIPSGLASVSPSVAGPLLVNPAQFAGFGARLWALIVDGLVGLGFVLPGYAIALGGAGERDGGTLALGLLLAFAGSVAQAIIYCVKVGRHGQSWGNKAAGISIVDARSGLPIGGGRAFGRTLARGISGLPCYLGYLWMLWDPMKQTWHDKMVGSVVIKGAPHAYVAARAPVAAGAVQPVSAFPGVASPEPVSANPARWAADPFDRFEQRYWDGKKWTENVASRGILSVDPAQPVRLPPPQVPSLDPVEPVARQFSPEDLHDGRTITPGDLSTIRRGAKKMSLTLDTGEIVALTTPLVIGRDPIRLDHIPGGQLLPLDDPDRSVSKTHCAIGQNQLEVWVEDCSSANGTVVVEADGREFSVRPGTRIVTEPGSTVRFGDRWLRINN